MSNQAAPYCVYFRGASISFGTLNLLDFKLHLASEVGVTKPKVDSLGQGILWVILIASVLRLIATAEAQTINITRLDSAYFPNNKLDPATLLASSHFQQTASRQYVVVEGYIDYVATAWPEADGDYHFEMQSTNTLRDGGVSPIGLVCEIDPVLQLSNSAALRPIDSDKRQTYRKARVYGYLRFGTEKTNHSGIKVYNIGNGGTIKGHWEIHPVEKVISIDNGTPFQIGPSAKYASWPISKRYKLNDTNFKSQTASNYAALRGNVKSIERSPDQSGDLDVVLEVNSTKYTATIPQYYFTHFAPITQAVTLLHLPNFKSVNYLLKPSDSKIRTFYGLRNWHFSHGDAKPALQPVEMIK